MDFIKISHLQDRIDEAEALVAELRAETDSLPAMQVRA